MKKSVKIIIAGAIIAAVALYAWWRLKKRAPTVSSLEYPIGDYDPKRPVIEAPKPGIQSKLPTKQCVFSNVVKTAPLETAQKIIEDHLNETEGYDKKCDIDCDNVFIEELYESYLVKFLLEDSNVHSEIIAIYKKIYDGIRLKIGDKSYQNVVKYWENINEDPLYPVGQKDRNWSDNASMMIFPNGNRVNPFLLKQMTGVSDIDPTALLLSADFLKSMITILPDDFSKYRDYIFNNILKRARGYRTNSKNRFRKGSKKGSNDWIKEPQIGITSFDYPDLILQQNTYYKPTPFTHPGRSKCKTVPLQGMYEHEAERKNIPIMCGISGSTNFWTWTALYSGVNLTLRETRLYLLSAFIVLNADGGHTLMEVLSSATLSSIIWKDYLKYSKDDSLKPYIERSNFAKNLYEITKNINPLGERAMLTIDKSKVANDIFNSKDKVYPAFDDTVTVLPAEARLRMELESYFLQDNDRWSLPFGNYSTFLGQIPETKTARVNAIKKLKEHVKNFCT